MNTMLFPEDIDNVIQSFWLCNNGDEATEDLILAIGAELLDISADEMRERIGAKEGLILDGVEYFLIGENRREAYHNYIESEQGGAADLKLTFEEFDAEIAKGAASDYFEIARLHETPDGKVWCATEYYG